ncbi:hypothetical protein C0993_007317 [Termitomyces sp. T159_Od127]|nr:hypothetical protein C0993_007317 [Termitomyces sp. T159_Od127]
MLNTLMFSIQRNEEIGVYGFVFFRDARWVAVIIDDFLYTSFPKFDDLSPKERQLYHDNEAMYNNVARRRAENLHFAKSAAEDSQETWVPLYEKAYAKLHGNYAALNSGYVGEAIEDLTGDYKRKNGLVGRHAYSVLRAVEYKKKRFVVLRNPWGNHEWNGPWSDGSKEWTDDWLPALKELKHSFGADGQFVMEYKDFLENCETIDRTLLLFGDSKSSWTMFSRWLRVKPRPCLEWGYGDVSFTISLARTSSIIIVLSKLDERYFRGRGEKNRVASSSPSVFLNQRSVNAELKDLPAGEYIVHVRLDNQSPVVSPSVISSRDEISQTLRNAVYPTPLDNLRQGWSMSRPTENDTSLYRCMTKNSKTVNHRILLRMLAEKLKSQLIASNSEKSTVSMYLSTPLDTLAGKDLLELSDDDDNRIKVSLEEGLEPQALNSTIVSGDGPGRNESMAEEFENEDVSEDGVTFPEFLDPDTIVLGLRVYIRNMSESPGSPVVIKGQCRQN